MKTHEARQSNRHDASLASAYSESAAAWSAGPERLYDRLADVALDRCPRPLRGATVLDLGAGTGAASRAATRRGACVVAVDFAAGMVASLDRDLATAAAGDAVALPFRAAAFDGVVAAFSLNHLADPVAGLVEVRRVLRPAGVLVATAYAADDTHPVKEAVEAAASARGWAPPPWYRALRHDAVPKLATEERARAAATAAGLADAAAVKLTVPFPDLTAGELVAWRLGMAQVAPFAAALSARERAELTADALTRLGPAPPPLVRSVIVLTAHAPS